VHRGVYPALGAFALLLAAAASLIIIGRVEASQPAQAQQPTTSPNGLVINEVYESQNPGNEYFELYNTSAVAINLSTYYIYNRDGSTPLSRLDDPVIGPGQFRVIGPTQLHTNTIGGPTGLDRTDFLGLVNTSPTDTVIDVVNWGSSPNPNWPNYERFRTYFFTANIPQLPAQDGPKSLQRWPDGQDTDQGTDWDDIASSPGAPSCDDPYEPDNTFATASNQSVDTTTVHRLCPAADQDWTAVSMSTSFTYTLQAEAVGSRIDTVMRLYDANNNLLAMDDNPNSRNSTIVFRPTSSQSFRIQIIDKNSGGTSGPDYLYNLRISGQVVSTPTPTPPVPTGCEDMYEPDDNMSSARYIELNTEQVHILCKAAGGTDHDWVTFIATTGKVYSMYTKDLAAVVDTVITLYDARGNVLAENDDYQPGQGLASRIDYSFSADGQYFLRIRDKRNRSGPGYQYTVGLSSTGQLPPTTTPTRTQTPSPFTPTPTQGPCTDAYEPDGVPETARVILIGSTQRHTICPATDADWVRFYARAGKVYTIRTSNLGVGLDTYMYIFDSDARRILAQNDDGGEGVASRIDFYPVRDDWYFAQVKNAGDIGGPEQTYDLSLAVVPGAPQPPNTATAIIAPPVTGTPVREPIPTAVVQPTQPPTRPPVPTPTLAGTPPPTPPAAQQPTATVEPIIEPTEEPTPIIPNVPITGAREDPKPKSPQPPVPPVIEAKANPVASYAPVLFRIFYDRNRNDGFDAGEGIRGIDVYFLNGDGGMVVSGRITTSANGTGWLRIPAVGHRIYIPYLGINMNLNNFPARETHSIWLPPVQLPDRVP
jgi:hypothetical protein